MIRFTNVSFRFSGAVAPSLNAVDLEITAGSCVVFTGKSGSGKTTLTRCINGLIPFLYKGEFSGRITLAGTVLAESWLWETEPVCGSVFQDPRSQFFTTNTTSEVAFGLENYGICPREINRRVDEVLAVLRIRHLKDRSVFALSSGEKQKIAVASAFALHPKVLVLDEPSANLDIASTLVLREMLRTLKEQGYTLIISEHRLYYLQEVADRMIHLEQGRIAWEADRAAISGMTRTSLASRGLRTLCLEPLPRGSAVSIPSPAADAARLDVKKLTFRYTRNAPLLHNATFAATGGDIIGIVGGNGRGKTTLAKILCGLLEPDSGVILLDGRSVTAKERLKASYFVMQDADYQLYAESVTEEITLGCPVSEGLTARVEGALAALGLQTLATRHPGSLSGGQKQRVIIAALLVQDARLLFLDEPTSGLDYEHMQLVSSVLRSQAEQGKIIGIISHDYEFVQQTCTRILQLDENGITKALNISRDDDLYEIMFAGEIHHGG